MMHIDPVNPIVENAVIAYLKKYTLMYTQATD